MQGQPHNYIYEKGSNFDTLMPKNLSIKFQKIKVFWYIDLNRMRNAKIEDLYR